MRKKGKKVLTFVKSGAIIYEHSVVEAGTKISKLVENKRIWKKFLTDDKECDIMYRLLDESAENENKKMISEKKLKNLKKVLDKLKKLRYNK